MGGAYFTPDRAAKYGWGVPRLLLVALFAFEGVPRLFISSAASTSDAAALQLAPYLASMRWAGHSYLGSIGRERSCCFDVTFLNAPTSYLSTWYRVESECPRVTHPPHLPVRVAVRGSKSLCFREQSGRHIIHYTFTSDSDRPSQSSTEVPQLLLVPALDPASGRGRERASRWIPRQPGAATGGRRGLHLGRGARLLHPGVPHEDLQRRLPGGSA